MAIDFKTPEQIANEYLLHLKSLKPEVNTAQTDSDWFIKSRVYGGVVAGVYADIRKISDDAFPQSARREALERHLETYFDEGFKQPTKAVGPVLVQPTSATGPSAAVGELTFVYGPNGNLYTNTEAVTITQPTGNVVNVQSVNTGQIQNLLAGTPLTVQSPPAGFSSSAQVFGDPLSDGSDVETNEEAAARILARIREPIRGGTASDYEQWALESNDAVVSANILRYPQGFGSVGVIVAAGTTNIDEALDNGDPIVLVPSDQLLDTVAAYIEERRPLTDYVIVYKPVEVPIDVDIKVSYAQGNGSTILTGQTLTQAELIEREIKRAIYKTPAGGRQIGASGYVLASEIEEVVDLALSASPHAIGTIQMLRDRQVQDLTASGANRLILNNEIAVPGTITVQEF